MVALRTGIFQQRIHMSLFDWLWGKKSPEQGHPDSDAGAPFADVELQTDDETRDAEQGPKRPVLYMFQYVALPEAAFENHPELIRAFEEEGSSPMPLLHFQSKAHLECVHAGWIDPDQWQTEAGIQRDLELFKTVSVHPHKRNGYTAYVVKMPVPESLPEAHFVAIVYKDDEPKVHGSESPSTRYFTLEKSHTPLPVLCECMRDGSRRNYGEGPAPEISDFVEAVFARVFAGTRGSNRVRLEGGCAALMMFAPRSTTDYHLVSVEFEDGTRVTDAKVYDRSELQLPPQFVGKKIKSLAINARQP